MTRGKSRPEFGFSLVEMVVVVGIVLAMAAVGLPGLARYVRNYRVRAGAQQVAAEMQTARTKAIMRNVNRGVVFAVLDADTYAYMIEDPPAGVPPGPAPDPVQLGPLEDLPVGIRFVPANQGFAMRFDRLGRSCLPGSADCLSFAAGTIPCVPESRCQDAVGDYIATDAEGEAVVRVVDPVSGLVRSIRVAPGGRVVVLP